VVHILGRAVLRCPATSATFNPIATNPPMVTLGLPPQRHSRAPAAMCRRRGGAGCGPVLFTVSDAKSKRGGGGSERGSAGALNPTRTFQLGMLSGAAAGFAVDAILFPLDTLKTRLQMVATAPARQALFKGVYNGFAPAMYPARLCACRSRL
jgi:hypothetical protein